jgi:hypothetical protein
LRKDYQSFQGDGGRKERAKFHHSVSNDAIIFKSKSDDIRVLEVCAIPTLHCFLGIVNKTFGEMSKIIPEVDEWPKKLHVKKDNYHGSVFEGNECKKLMDNLHVLEKILLDCDQSDIGKPFVKVFSTFSQINHLINSPKINIDVLKQQISQFAKVWKESGMSLTTKVHIIIDHLIDFVVLRGENNLRLFSEQTHEAVHAEFWKTWAKYEVKDISNPIFEKRLLRAVLDYNGSHAH